MSRLVVDGAVNVVADGAGDVPVVVVSYAQTHTRIGIRWEGPRPRR